MQSTGISTRRGWLAVKISWIAESTGGGRSVRALAIRVGLILLMLTLFGIAEGAVVRVKVGATGVGNGHSWVDAYTDLQPALAVAKAGDEIWVAAGTYKPTAGTDRAKSFVMVAGVGLYGGFAGTETAREERDWQAHATILSGEIGAVGDQTDNTCHVVVGANNAVLDGFTVTGGYNGNHGAGMLNDSVSPAISNCTIRGNVIVHISDKGNYVGGGGVCNINGSPTFSNCTVSSNSLRDKDDGTTYGNGIYIVGGGGICNAEGSPTFSDCTISGNTVIDGSTHNIDVTGGGICNYSSSPAFNDCTISGNSTIDGDGGGIYNAYSSPTFSHCAFIGNINNAHFVGAGGGIYNIVSNPSFSHCTFTGNSASENGMGGGIYNYLSSPTISNCTFSGNLAGAGGGGIYISSYSSSSDSPTISNCTFNGNSTNMGVGGGIGISEDAVTITNCTFSGNSADMGGGVYSRAPFYDNDEAKPMMGNCTFSGNSANYGSGLYISDEGQVTSTVINCIFWANSTIPGSAVYRYRGTPTFRHCNIQGSRGSGGAWNSALGIDGGGNIMADPLFMDAAHPAGADGLWRTADDGLMLRTKSPCVNSGDTLDAPEQDILGFSRGVRPDIGAYEYQARNAAAVWAGYR